MWNGLTFPKPFSLQESWRGSSSPYRRKQFCRNGRVKRIRRNPERVPTWGRGTNRPFSPTSTYRQKHRLFPRRMSKSGNQIGPPEEPPLENTGKSRRNEL